MKAVRTFKISHKLIWFSSLFLGMLTAVPKIAEHQFRPYEALVDSSVTFLFALIIWYYNVYNLPRYTANNPKGGFSTKQLLKGLFFGLVLMFLLACIQQYLLSHLPFGPVMLMFEVRSILISSAFYMFIHLLYQSYLNQQVSVELERTTAANVWAQYELLKQQVNPHFLFNSLNTLKYMVESGDPQAVNFILKLSDFYRFTLESRKLDLIDLSEELKILEAYMYLLKARFENGIELSTNLPEKVHTSPIPPFTLQLLIENCIKHNIVSLEKPLQIRLYLDTDYLVIENNIQLKREPESSTGLGLENINQRYQHLLDREIVIEVTDNTFTIKLPVIYESNHH
ncbi:MAG: histidine kinase [Pseudosphingobacterium sp.]|uniref:sensor histidine kinase n=1 Tax=unclassified Olivibacter TaxID=2632301 RepID=UPI0011EA7B89|nr:MULTISPECIES: histidine kinase [unclassified Olivibacter]MDM8173275.1 histidine kinase [Olivibacter sp. 47]MDX3915279.1 histidine kinase [Pseudosphingobacterium sp.]QEL03057.1 histidine kinase [Olivibacter sp. LS-1]